MEEIIKRVQAFGLDFDHYQHQVLYNAAKDIVGVEGIVCEVGLRQGGGMGIMILGCLDSNNTERPFVAIDPYGNLMYSAKEGEKTRYDYTNEMKYNTMINLYKLALSKNILVDLITLEDTEFFKKFEDGVPIYNIDKHLYNNYALVHLDGPHFLEEVLVEVNFFKSKISLNGYIVVDDTTFYDISKVEEALTLDGQYIKVIDDGKKASFKRIK